MNACIRPAAIAALLSLTTACSFHSTATHWNGRVDESGKPVFVKTTTNIGFNLAIILPLMGNTTIDAMIDEATRAIAEDDGDYVRVIQSSSENYWYGWSPFTWVLTPIVTDVALEYRPSELAWQEAQADNADFERRQRERRSEDNSQVVPDGNTGREKLPDEFQRNGTSRGGPWNSQWRNGGGN